MPTYEFTSPDGKKYRIEGPEGSTREEAFQLLQEQYDVSKGGPPPMDGPESSDPPVVEADDAYDFSAKRMVKNIPGDAYNVGKSIVDALANPLETAKSMGNLIEMGGDILTRGGRQNYQPDARLEELRASEERIKQAMMDKYGSVDKFQRTLETEPVSTGMDVATLGIPVIAAAPNTAAKVLRTTTNPIQGAKVASRLTSKAIPERLPQTLYERAAKFSTTLSPEDKATLSATALREGITLTPKGFEKLNTSLRTVGSQIDELIVKATSEGKSVPTSVVFDKIDELKADLGGVTRIEGTKNLKKINDMVDAYKAQLSEAGVTNFSPQQLQDFKTNLYNEINFARSQLSSTPVPEAVRRNMASSAKGELEQVMPGIGELNQRYGPLKNLQENLQPVISRVANRDPVSLSTLGKMGIGEMVAPGTGAGLVAGAAAGYAGMPGVQSRLANALYKMKHQDIMRPGYIPPELYPILYQSEQANNAQ